MKNRILSLTRGSIPYVKEIRPLAHSMVGCVLMQQLDYWFVDRPNGFYKFMAPCDHALYKPGDSWTEELGVSLDEYRTAFDKIGTRWPSKTAFEAAADKFKGKFYCSYHDKRAQLTFYFRNHEVLDRALDELLLLPNTIEKLEKTGPKAVSIPIFDVDGHPRFTVDGHSQSTVNGQSRSTVNGQTQLTVGAYSRSTVDEHSQATVDGHSRPHEIGKSNVREMGNPNSGITENNKDYQSLQQPDSQSVDGQSSSCSISEFVENLTFPVSAKPVEREALAVFLQDVKPESRQQVLDEIEGTIRANSLKKSMVALCGALVKAERNGTFVPSLGVAVRAGREATLRQKQTVDAADARASDVSQTTIDPVLFAKLPPGVQAKVTAALNKP